jgi:hypothetical protein
MRRLLPIVLAITLALAAPAAASADTLHVAKGGVDAPACADPGAPCATVAYAVGQAASGDTIQIGPGTFVESVETDKVLTFVGAGAGTLGGFPPATTIQGPNGSGTAGLTALVLDAGGSVRDLRAIGGEGGSEALTNGDPGGDGITYRSSVPTPTELRLEHVVVIGGNGGAGKTPDVFDFGTGGVGLDARSTVGPVAIVATESEFASGEGTGGGGAVNVIGPQATADLVDSRLQSEQTIALGGGGAITGYSDTRLTLTSVEIDSEDAGATIYEGSMTVRRSRILAEYPLQVVASGGTSSSGELIDSQVISTVGEAALSEAYDSGSTASLEIAGSTVVGLYANAAVTAHREEDSGAATVVLRNSVARHLPPPGLPSNDLYANGGTINTDHSSFTTKLEENGGTATTPGSGTNLDADPLFVNPSKGDFALQGTSPLIDRGDPGVVAAGQLDLIGNPRALDGNRDCAAAPDIGAYEVTGQGVECDPPPTISGFGLTNKAFAPKGAARKPGRRGAAGSARKRIKRGTKFTYTLSEPARVSIVIERKKPRRGKKPRWVKATTLSAQEEGGKQNTPFSGKVRRRLLKPGRYRARITATDSAGQRSAPKQRGFTVLPG